MRIYRAGECFGASGLLPGDSYRRDTATAMGAVTLKVIPHNHFKVRDGRRTLQPPRFRPSPLPNKLLTAVLSPTRTLIVLPSRHALAFSR